MYFKPIDEMSLRQLFSTDLAKGQLKLAYIGPVINSTGQIETSPDGLLLDMRNSPYRLVRGEFKYVPTSAGDFSHNGKFDIAVIWDYGQGTSKQQLEADLLRQNGCAEIVSLAEHKVFRNLPEFSYDHFSQRRVVENLEPMLLKRELHSVMAAYIAVRKYPKTINSTQLVDFLAKKLPSVAKMQPQGRGNIISAFMQTNPALIKHMNLNNYRWNADFDPVTAASVIASILKDNFASDIPSDEDLNWI